jgi:hypothetical protein
MKKSRVIVWISAAVLLTACGGGGSGPVSPPSTSTNLPPTANAGTAQSVATGSTASLDGSGSADPNGDSLTFSWSLTTRPTGSSASLSGPTGVKPTFVPDVAGTYVVTLVVNDGKIDSAASTVAITATVANSPPVANAGAAQNVIAGSVVALDGTGSTDANGDQITYSWSLTSRPAGSTATLTAGTSPKPTFIADIAGSYVASLVVSDGKSTSPVASVTITAATTNSTPVANAGTAQNPVVGSTVRLDGSGSTDANGDSLTYIWTLTTRPIGSNAALTAGNSSIRTFVADLAGVYVATLVVNDGKADSAPATVTITVASANAVPVANAGGPQNLLLDAYYSTIGTAVVALDGSGSTDANRDSLTFVWALTWKPAGSRATLSDSTSVRPTFIADSPGVYVVTLVVNDGKVSSSPATSAITVDLKETEPNNPYGLANLLTLDGAIVGNLSSYSDVDIFRTSISLPGQLTIEFTPPVNPPGKSYFTIVVYNSFLERNPTLSPSERSDPFIASFTTGKAAIFTTNAAIPGRYFIVIQSSIEALTDQNIPTENYRLRVIQR